MGTTLNLQMPCNVWLPSNSKVSLPPGGPVCLNRLKTRRSVTGQPCATMFETASCLCTGLSPNSSSFRKCATSSEDLILRNLTSTCRTSNSRSGGYCPSIPPQPKSNTHLKSQTYGSTPCHNGLPTSTSLNARPQQTSSN